MSECISAAEQRRHRLEDKLRRELGPTILAALADPDVVEVMLNPDGRIWVDELGKGMRDTDATMRPAQAESLLGTVAMLLNTVVNADRPLLEAELPIDGSRIGGALPPVVATPAFAIRKRALRVFTLDDYVRSGTLEQSQADAIRAAIAARENILIAGSTGSGKTTFANALLHEIGMIGNPRERIVILEDTVELQCAAANHVELRTTDGVDMTGLVRLAMRLRPDRIIVGEVRGPEALALLKAWNTGHPGGVSTIHANDCLGALHRLEQLIEEAAVAVQPMFIANAIQCIVHVVRRHQGHGVQRLAKLRGWSSNVGYVLAG
jgi:P-type conjugative transfer ATPase TrbB